MLDMVIADVPRRNYKVWARIEDDLSLTIGVWKINEGDNLSIDSVDLVSVDKAAKCHHDYFRRSVKALEIIRTNHPSFYEEILDMLKRNKV